MENINNNTKFDLYDHGADNGTNEQIMPVENTDNTNVQNKYTDLNTIQPTIRDQESPLVIFFGESSCGKTMTLIRLSRFLIENDYQIQPDRNFRPSDDENYKRLCDEFPQLIDANTAAKRTDKMDFMLIKVIKDTHTICQILEAPGEHFAKAEKEFTFPTYIQTIYNKYRNIPKTWVFFVGIDENDENYKVFQQNVAALKRQMITPNDRVIIICNKSDLHNELFIDGEENVDEFRNKARDNNKLIFNAFKNKMPIISWFKPYTYDSFVVFSAGTFQPLAGDDGYQYTESDARYPEKLWKAILNTIR